MSYCSGDSIVAAMNVSWDDDTFREGSTFGHQNHWQLPHGQNIIMHACNVAHALDDTEKGNKLNP
jgi:hypothetical protein